MHKFANQYKNVLYKKRAQKLIVWLVFISVKMTTSMHVHVYRYLFSKVEQKQVCDTVTLCR